MRRLAAAATVLIFLVSACGDTQPADETGETKALATISILADFVRAVAGDRIEVESIVHIGGDPHTYEPTPSDARRAAEADIVFRNGMGLERWLDDLIRTDTERPVVTLTEGLDPLIQDTGAYEGDPDPHAWMDPSLVGGYVDNAEAALIELDPDGADTYRANADAYRAELEELDGWIREQVETIPEANRKLVTTHDAFRYFGSRYGFDVVGTIWSISTEREPSGDELRRLVDDVRSTGVPTVFIETTINPRLMEQVARDAEVDVGEPLYGDSVGEPGSGADDYLGMMRANVEAIVTGLGGERQA